MRSCFATKLASRLLNNALEAEMVPTSGCRKDSSEGDGSGNRRNGHSEKTVITGDGETVISVFMDCKEDRVNEKSYEDDNATDSDDDYFFLRIFDAAEETLRNPESPEFGIEPLF